MHSVNSLAFMLLCLAAPLSLAAAAVPGGAAGKVPLHTMLEEDQGDGAGVGRKVLAAGQRFTMKQWSVSLRSNASNGINSWSTAGEIRYSEYQSNYTSRKTAAIYVSLTVPYLNNKNEEVARCKCFNNVERTPQSFKAGWSTHFAGALLDVVTIKELLKSQPLDCKVSSKNPSVTLACSASLEVGSKSKCLTGDSMRSSKCVYVGFNSFGPASGSTTTTTSGQCNADTAGSTVVAVMECGGPVGRWEMSASEISWQKIVVELTA